MKNQIDEHRYFAYKSTLYRYLCDNHDFTLAYSSFRRYIKNTDEFNNYFKSHGQTKPECAIRYETNYGEQAQIDWKESVKFLTKDGEYIDVNIFVFILSSSRFRYYQVSLSKNQEVLLHFLNNAFELIGGVVHTVVTDNMKTVMDIARTKNRNGKVNNKFKQFADDYGFKIHPCIAVRPQTKGKVETQMKILDEILAYNGKISYEELIRIVSRINERDNNTYHHYYRKTPIIDFQKEKDFLKPLPNDVLRSQYRIKSITCKVNKSSMITYKSNQYSVPPKYIDKLLNVEVIENLIHVYYNKKLVTVHDTSTKKLNYHQEHYTEIAKLSLPFKDDKIAEIAKDNLTKLGEIYK